MTKFFQPSSEVQVSGRYAFTRGSRFWQRVAAAPEIDVSVMASSTPAPEPPPSTRRATQAGFAAAAPAWLGRRPSGRGEK